jgi:adenylate cyclase
VNPPSGHRKTRHQRKRFYHALVLTGVGCLLILVALLVQPFYTINSWFSDQLFTSELPSPNIVIAGIDDKTLETYGLWAQWSRSLHAQAIDNLVQAGAKVIGFDVVFADSSADDDTLATAIAKADNVVLAAVGIPPISQIKGGITYDNFLLPVASLNQAASSIGHANVIPDGDGTVRRLPLIVKSSSGQVYPSLTLAVLYRLASMALPQEYVLENGAVHLLARDVPVDSSYRLRINFAADNQLRPYVSYGDVISGNFDRSLVKNKIVLIGMTATGEPDTWAVPTSPVKIPGVYIHAAAMDTILTERFLREPNTIVTLMIMLLLVGITASALPHCGTRNWTDIAKGVGVTAGLFVAYLVAGFLAFDRGYSLNLFYPLSLLPLVYVSNIIYIVITEQRDKRFVKALFGRYISPQIAREIVRRADTGELRLGGEQREITVLFADIRNFTRISELLSPEAIVKMLNTYLSVIADAVVQHDGIVNKFGGDNIMAVWNAPQPQPEHALLAVKAAWEAQHRIAEVKQSDTQLFPVEFGIGINTGVALAGNIGSVGRSEYTVIGDSVNTSSRICGNTPGGEVWIGAETYNQTKDYIETEKLESQSFKGKAEPITVYRITALRPATTQSKGKPSPS